MAGRSKGKQAHLIKQIREVIYDLGKPVTLREILENCTHLSKTLTQQRLSNILRKKDFVVISHFKSSTAAKISRADNSHYKCNLYWLADTEGIASIPKCTVCGVNIKMQRKGALRCSDCYKLMKEGERRNGK
tara:strand:- start:98 stop:493 length:396 start_codon:yes stop_codon:yes gene_type:complete